MRRSSPFFQTDFRAVAAFFLRAAPRLAAALLALPLLLVAAQEARASQCSDAGWTMVFYDNGAEACIIPVQKADTKEKWPLCNLAGTAEGAPDCSEIFGENLTFPPIDAHSEGDFYAYNCPNNQILNAAGTGCACPPGHKNIGDACAEINECQTETHGCPGDSCVNTRGGYYCQCPAAHRFDAQQGQCVCEDDYIYRSGDGDMCILWSFGQDKCEAARWQYQAIDSKHICHVPIKNGATNVTKERCIFTGIGIAFPPGDPHIAGEIFCQDAFPNYDFPVKTTATYSPGDYFIYDCPEPEVPSADGKSCVCPPGYDNSNGTCAVDNNINECETGTRACGDNADCADTPGSYTCACRDGYAPTAISAQNPQCAEVNECVNDDDHSCGTNAACQNIVGSYDCACDSPQCDGSEPVVIAPPVNGAIVGRFGVSQTLAGLQNYLTLGAPVTFSADPASGYSHAGWTGACAGQAADAECQLAVAGKTTVGASFQDVDECAANTHNCDAAENERCANTVGGFSCVCASGYYRDGLACADGEVVSFLPSQNGTVSASGAGAAVHHGDAVPIGTTLTFAAAPNPGYRFSVWFGDCSGDAACQITATVNVSIGANFADINECAENTHNCADDGGLCRNTGGGFACTCASGYNGDGVLCGTDATVRFRANNDRGTLFAATPAGAAIHSGDAVTFQSTVIFTAQPAEGWQVSLWTGPCDRAVENACHVVATANFTVSAAFSDIDECRLETHACGIADACSNTIGGHTCACQSAGWMLTIRADNAASCLVPVHKADTKEKWPLCNLAGTAEGAPDCSEIFGENLTFPPINAHSEGESYAYDCPNNQILNAAGTGCACPPGHKNIGDACAEINECQTETHGCPGDSCVNTRGGYYCQCPPGYNFNAQQGQCACNSDRLLVFPSNTLCLAWHVGQENCENRGWDTEYIAPTQSCNIPIKNGSTNATKEKCAFEGDGIGAPLPGDTNVLCLDAFPDYDFPAKTTATYSPGDYFVYNCPGLEVPSADGKSCVCPPGYDSSGGTCAVDNNINECEAGTRVCGDNADCADTPGSYTCACRDGYAPTAISAQNPQCAEINECVNDDDHSCGTNAACQNIAGSYDCACDSPQCDGSEPVVIAPPVNGAIVARFGVSQTLAGLQNYLTLGAPVTFSADPAPGYAHAGWTGACAGQAAGAECQLAVAGKTTVGASFQDFDECVANTHNCAAESERCANTVGGFSCVCAPGYYRDGLDCASGKIISLLSSQNGTISASSSAGAAVHHGDAVPIGTKLTFAAVPNPGYRFSVWLVSCSGSSACQITVDAFPVNVGAIFTDINECAENTHNCADDGGLCRNTGGGFACTCASGYNGDGVLCGMDATVRFRADGDRGTLFAATPAGAAIHSGDALTFQSTVIFTAQPAKGWQVSLWTGPCDGTVGKACDVVATANFTVSVAFSDIDECRLETHACGTADACSNTIGGHTCACQSAGWMLTIRADNAASCLIPVHKADTGEKWPLCNLAGTAESAPDCSEIFGENLTFPPIDAHSEGDFYAYDCPNNQILNAAGTGCACPPGHKNIGDACAEINECQTETHGCPGDSCVNTRGGYYCLCPGGHRFDAQQGQCVCEDQYRLSADKCITSLAGRDRCKAAKWDFKIIDKKYICYVPIKNGTDNVTKENCIFTGPIIALPPGDLHLIADEVFCQDAFPGYHFPVKTTATYSPGDYFVYDCPGLEVPSADGKSCVCPPGYDSSGGTCAVDNNINECETGTHACGDNADCADTRGSYTCACHDGYAPTAISAQNPQCAEINECVNDDDHSCGTNAVCQNIAGSYGCACDSPQCDGSEPVVIAPPVNGTIVARFGVSQTLAGLQNYLTLGAPVTFSADPAPGYSHAGWTGACAGQAAAAECRLAVAGKTTVGASFQDFDECAANTHNCDAAENERCANTVGGFSCVCAAGYYRDGLDCSNGQAVFFLPSQNGTVSASGAGAAVHYGDSVPIGTTLTFTAVPNPGYRFSVWSGDCDGPGACQVTVASSWVSVGADFIDINECAENTHNCADDGGLCRNTGGGFACTCASGYDGDGLLCGTDRTVHFRADGDRGTLFAATPAGAAIHSGDAVTFQTTVIFTAQPAKGWQISLWTGPCDGTVGNVCHVVATANFTVSAAFSDIDECAENTGNCAGIGGDCRNTTGSFLCEFASACEDAQWTSVESVFPDGPRRICLVPVTDHRTNRKHAGCTPYEISVSAFPSCSDIFGYPPVFPDSGDLQAGESYAFNCGEGEKQSADKKSCLCPPGRERHDGTCVEFVSVLFPSPANGTISARSAGISIQSGAETPRGATVAFTVASNDGWQISAWTGDCAGAAGDSCTIAATVNVSVGVIFADIDECAANTHDCAEIGGACQNTRGSFLCEFRDNCRSAGWGGTVAINNNEDWHLCNIPLQNVADGREHPKCALYPAGSNSIPSCLDAFGVPPDFPPEADHQAGQRYVYNCVKPKIQSDDRKSCVCPPERPKEKNDGTCLPLVTVSFLPPDNGTLSAENDDGPVHNGDAIAHGTTVTFIAAPNNGWQVFIWLDDCARIIGDSCAVEAAANVSVGVLFYDINECATNAHDCAPVGGDCGNTEGGFTCSCVSGYSGDGKICNTDKTVSFLPPDNGTLSAENDGGPVHNGGIILHGTTVTFAAAPDNGWQLSIWTGHCAGTTGDSCAVEATMNVSVGVAFSDINECATNAHDCAPIGGDCGNTLGGFTCSCLSGYSGDGKTCNADKTVSFLPPDNGALSAENDGGPVHNGGAIAHGTTVTFAAAPNSGWQLSIWTGHCAGTTGDSCAVDVTANVSVGVAFSDINECATNAHDCAPVGGDCDNTLGGFTCSCLSGYSGDGKTCNADKTVSFLPPDNGALSAENDGGPVHNGNTIAHGTTVTFAAAPNSGWQLSIWTGHCAGTTGDSCAVEADMNVSVGVAFSDINECATNAHDCAPVGGDCDNTLGGFTCSCLSGYSGDGKTCNADKTVSFLPPDNGTLSAENDDGPVHNGDIIAHGTTVTFAAAPNSGWQLSIWTGRCAGTTGDSCAVDVTANVSVGVAFSDINECATNAHDCAPVGGDCDNTLGGFTCSCLPGYSGDGKTCNTDKTVSFLPPDNGTLSAENDGGPVHNGDIILHGTTVTFAAAPNSGWQISIWTGRCAGTTGDSCAVDVTANVSVGVVFSDINECATNAHDCAPVGGDCDNTLGGFTCSCLPGYSGDGKTCNTDKNIEIFPSSNGTIFAGALADSLSGQIVRSTVRNGENIAHGTTIRFRALPDANGPGFDFYVRQWTGDCAALLTAPSSDRALSLAEQTCELTANQNLRVGAIFGRAWRVSLSTPPNGTVSARIKDGDPLTPARNAVPHRTTVIYTAKPGRGHYISGWEPGKPGRCDQQYQKTDIKSADPRECETVVNSPLFRTSSPAPIISPLPCLAIPGARHAAMDACECETDGHLIFGAPPGLFCASPTICPQNYAGDDCLPPVPDASAPLPQAANTPDACRSIFGGRIQTAENSQTVCSGVDHNDTFCIIGSRDAFPCRGLFNHIWKCNQTNRPALNPFFCGAPCADGDNASRGRHCGKKSVADDTFN